MNQIISERIYKATTVVFKYVIITILAAYCVSLLIPLIWMLYTSFKDGISYYTDTYGLPEVWNFKNYVNVWELLSVKVLTTRGVVVFDIYSMIGTSFFWSTSVSFLNVFVTTMVAYVISKYKFRFGSFLYALGIFVMITPIVGSLPTAMLMRKALGIYNNMLFTIFISPSRSFSGLHFLLLYAAFKRLSWSYAEAAFIDGANHYSVFFKIMLPMMLPTCTVLFVLNFLAVWNDYMSFLIWLPSYANLAYGIYIFQIDAASYGATMPDILAGFVVVMIPTIALYAVSQKLIMSKFTVGGLKG